jgi:hypothetical protein
MSGSGVVERQNVLNARLFLAATFIAACVLAVALLGAAA